MTDSAAVANRRGRATAAYGCATVVAVFVAVVVCSGLVLRGCTDPGPSPAGPTQTVPITGSVALSLDGRTVIYSPPVCEQAALTASETGSRVTLTLTTSDAGLADCAFSGNGFRISTISALLRGPLGSRSLIDAASGHPVAYLAENTVLRPRQPMFDWTTGTPDDPMADVSTVMAYFGGPGSAVLVENFHETTGSGQLAVVQTDGRWNPPAGTAVHPITVRAHDGLAAPGIIVWPEGGRTVAIVASTVTDPTTPGRAVQPGTPVFIGTGDPLTTPQLLAIAATLIGGSQ